MTFKVYRKHYARLRSEKLGKVFVLSAVMVFVLWFVTQCHQVVLAQ